MRDFIDSKGLVNVIQQPDGLSCQCPVCASEGHDLASRNHLKIFKTGKFHCIRGSSVPGHNRALCNLLYKGEDLEIIFTPVEPKTKVVKVYPESMLLKLVPDYTYWNGRGINDSTLKLFGGGLAPLDEKGKLSNRFVFPVRDELGRLIGFSGRLVKDNEFVPSWKHLVPSSLALFPLHLAAGAIKETGALVLVESIGDALKCFQMGVKNVLVLFGLNLSSKMIAALLRLNPSRIIISTNNDKGKGNGEAGNRAAATIRNALLSFFDEERVIIHLPLSNDWGVAQDVEFEELKKVVIG